MSGHGTRDGSLSGGLCALSASGLRPEPRRNLQGVHFFGSVFILCSSTVWQENRSVTICICASTGPGGGDLAAATGFSPVIVAGLPDLVGLHLDPPRPCFVATRNRQLQHTVLQVCID